MFINVSGYFLDESTIVVLNDKAQTVCQRSGEVFLRQCMKKRVNILPRSWFEGAISVHGTSRLHIVEETMNQVKYVQVLEGRLL